VVVEEAARNVLLYFEGLYSLVGSHDQPCSSQCKALKASTGVVLRSMHRVLMTSSFRDPQTSL